MSDSRWNLSGARCATHGVLIISCWGADWLELARVFLCDLLLEPPLISTVLISCVATVWPQVFPGQVVCCWCSLVRLMSLGVAP